VAKSITTIGIVGAGAMGAGIAQIALTAGFEVILYDANEKALGKAAEDVALRIARLVEKGQVQPEMIAQAAAKLVLANGLEDFKSADVVIEAIVEQLEPKQGLFQALEMVVREDAILASNTSSLSIAAIARACKHPGRVCGLHFFNPVPLMKLVEVIFGPATDPAVIEAMLDLSKKLGKTAVRVKDGPGFLVNLGGRAYVTEALHVQSEGVADVEMIDRIMRDAAGFRMGPFELMDLTGIDVNFTASKVIWGGYMNDPRIKTAPLHENLFNAGRLGRKTGQGFHAYPENAPARPAYTPPEDDGTTSLNAVLPDADARFGSLIKSSGLVEVKDDKASPILISPLGEDAANAAVRLDLDPARVVAIDFTGIERRFVTLMSPLGGNGLVHEVAQWLNARGFATAVVKDSPGFVSLRILAMVANLGCEMAQIGIGAPQDIDLGMKLGQNYPFGPLELAEKLGPPVVLETLTAMQAMTGSDRYRPSLWLRRRAMLGLPIHTPD